MGRDGSVGIGVIGTGFGRTVVAPVFEATHGCSVVDVVSSRDEAAVRALCSHPEVDLISVHSPPFLHRRHVECALDAGRAVLCDKPFGVDASDAQAMDDAARDAGVVALLNFEFRHQPGRAALRSFIQDGAIGPVEHLQWTMFGSGFRRRRPRWLFDAELGGGWIGAWGSHAIDFLRWTLGEIVDAHAQPRVTVVDRTSREGHTVPSTADDGFTAWLRTENGATVAIDTTFVAAVDLPPRVIVLGSEGALEMESDTRIWRIDGGGRHEVFRYDPIDEDPHLAPMQHWAAVVRDAVQTGVVPAGAPTFADGVACARVMDTLRVGSG